MAILHVQKQPEFEEVEVELPFYYTHYLDRSTVYGRVNELGCVNVERNEDGFVIECEHDKPSRWSCYLKPGHKGNKGKFDKVLAEAQECIRKQLQGTK